MNGQPRKHFSTNSIRNLILRSIRAQRRKTQNAPVILQKKSTDFLKVGAAKLFFAIRRTGAICQNGSRRLTRKPYRGGNACRYAYSRTDGHFIFSRLHIQKTRSAIYSRTATLQRKQMRRAVSVNGCRNARAK